MTDRLNDNIAAFLTPPPSKGVQFTQGVVLSWDNETLHNTIEWRGITLTDVPMVEGINALIIRPGDVIGMLGWAPENAKGVGAWWILGKLSNPGEFIADLNVTAKIFRFVTENGDSLAFFGKEADGDPFWALYYGEDDERIALAMIDTVRVSLFDRTGNEVLGTDAASEIGLSRPYFNYTMVPTFFGESSGTGAGSLWPSTASAAYVEVLEGINSLWHPRFSYGISTATTGGGSVDWRITFDGVVAASGNGSATGTANVPGWGTTYNPGETAAIALETRVAGGATRAFAQVNRLYGRQS